MNEVEDLSDRLFIRPGKKTHVAVNRVRQEMEKSYSKLQAAAIVTKEVGHERVDVVHVYLGDKGLK